MNVDGIFFTHIRSELAYCFQKRQTFNIADRTADFHNDDINTIRRQFDACFNLIGDMRNHLDGSPQIITPPFFGNDRVVNLARGEIIVATQMRMGKSFIVPKVQISFGAIIGHKDFAMLKWVHGSGIDIDIGIQLLECYRKPPAFKECTDGCRGKPLTKR